MSNIFIYNGWVLRLQPNFFVVVQENGYRIFEDFCFWIPMKLHTTFILIPNEFEIISVVTLNSKGINEDLLLVGNCCCAETAVVQFQGGLIC